MSQESAGLVQLDLGINHKEFNRQINGVAGHAENVAGKAFKKLGFIVAGAFAIHKLVGFGKAAIDLASDLNEVQNVVDVTFGAVARDIDDFSKNVLHSLGMSELMYKRYASTMGAMLKSSGLAQRDVLALSKGITALTGDMASFYNLDHDTAFQKIRAGISGETEPLRQLGINMSVANLEAFALSQGIKKSYQQMSQAEQVLLRYNYLMSTTKDAQGDFARTVNDWANQTRILSVQWERFRTTLGQGFVNMLTPVLRGLNKFMEKLQLAAEYFKAFTTLIFGAQKTASTGAAAVAGLGDSMGGVGGAMDDVADGVKKAKKEVKGSVSAFDELNVIGQNAAAGLDDMIDELGGVGGVDFGGLGEAVTPDVDLGPLEQKLNSLKQVATDVVNYFRTAFAPTFEAVSAFGKMAFEGLKDSAGKQFAALKKAAEPVLQWFSENGVDLLNSYMLGAVRVWNAVFDTAKTIFDTLWDEALAPGWMLVSKMVVDALNILKDFWYTWGLDIVDGIVSALDSIKILFQQLWKNFLEPIVTNMLKTLTWLWDSHLKGLITEISKFVGKLITAALDIFNGFILPVASWLIETFGPAFANIFAFVTDVIGTALAVVIDVAKGIIKALGGIIDFITGVFTGDWERAWSGIKTFFSGITDGIAALFKGMVNLIIDGLNFLIRALNRLKIPEFNIPGIGKVGGWSFNLSEIPKLAQGGLVSGPTLAMVGDNRNAGVDPEVVTPLSKLQDMLGASNQVLVEVLLAILEAIERLDLNVDIDGERLTQIIREKLQSENNRVGKSMVTIGGVPV